MKNLFQYKYTIVILSLLLIYLSGCYKYPDLENYDYSYYSRVVGPEGDTINFFANYSNDSLEDIVVKLIVPPEALDSVIVFNMYQFGEYELASELHSGFSKIGTKFLYFVPFYESEGYHEHEQVEVSYHLSIDFKKPVTVQYNYLIGQGDFSGNDVDEMKLYYEYYKTINPTFKLYKIRIPKTDEWGQENNIRINWNTQGYPVGYNETDLTYIINGAWSQTNDWGSNLRSLENWTEVTDFELNPNENTITFDIYNTDFLYVLARIIQIEPDKLPPKIINYISENFPDETIVQAAFKDKEFNIYLSSRTLLFFDKKANFDRLMSQSISISDIQPIETRNVILNYIDNNYSNSNIQNISSIQYGDEFPLIIYRFTLSEQVTLLFNEFGEIAGIYNYGIDNNKVPQQVFDYINTNHSSASIVNITFDSTYEFAQYIAYLSDNTKLYFQEDGTWETTLSFNYPIEDLPTDITDYINNNFSGITIALVHYQVSGNGNEYYHIALMNAVYIIFEPNGELSYVNIPYFEEEDLPQDVKTSIQNRFSEINIELIDYYYDKEYAEQPEIYDIYFERSLNVEFKPNGQIVYLYGNEPFMLPPNIHTYINDNYSSPISEYEIYYDEEYQAIVWFIYLENDYLLIFDIDGNFIEEWGVKKFQKHKIMKEKRVEKNVI